MELSYFNPLRTYTTSETASLMHTSDDRVKEWERLGLIRSIVSGRGSVFTAEEISRFQKEMLGRNISNLFEAAQVAKEVVNEKRRSD